MTPVKLLRGSEIIGERNALREGWAIPELQEANRTTQEKTMVGNKTLPSESPSAVPCQSLWRAAVHV